MKTRFKPINQISNKEAKMLIKKSILKPIYMNRKINICIYEGTTYVRIL